jgi:hypothetical protein
VACRDEKQNVANTTPINPTPGLRLSVARSPFQRVPTPFGSRGELARRNGEVGPPGDIQPHDTSKGIGSLGGQIPAKVVPAGAARAKADYPVPHGTVLADPNAATTTKPLHRIHDQAIHWHRRNPIRPTVGDWVPLQGRARLIAPGVEGGQALPMAHSFPQDVVEKLLPFDLNARKRLRAFNLEQRRQRMLAKARVVLSAGLSGLQAAQAVRGKPGTPSGILGSGRQEPALPTMVRGRRNEQDWAPTPILLRMAQQARRHGSPV